MARITFNDCYQDPNGNCRAKVAIDGQIVALLRKTIEKPGGAFYSLEDIESGCTTERLRKSKVLDRIRSCYRGFFDGTYTA